MDSLTLLREARRAGLQVAARGDKLVVQGPRRLESVARSLLAEKPRILRALAEEREIAWRVDAMRPFMTSAGAIPLLLARPQASRPIGSCCSCGDRLDADERYRCKLCVAAAMAVLRTTR